MDSTAPPTADSSILMVENNAEPREAITLSLTQVGYEVILVPSGSGEAAFDLIVPTDLDGLTCATRLFGRADGWKLGAIFNLLCRTRPVVHASEAGNAPLGAFRPTVFFRKPFELEMLVRAFDTGARSGNCLSGIQSGKAEAGARKSDVARIKIAIGSVYLS